MDSHLEEARLETADKKPVKNGDLWLALDDAALLGHGGTAGCRAGEPALR